MKKALALVLALVLALSMAVSAFAAIQLESASTLKKDSKIKLVELPEYAGKYAADIDDTYVAPAAGGTYYFLLQVGNEYAELKNIEASCTGAVASAEVVAFDGATMMRPEDIYYFVTDGTSNVYFDIRGGKNFNEAAGLPDWDVDYLAQYAKTGKGFDYPQHKDGEYGPGDYEYAVALAKYLSDGAKVAGKYKAVPCTPNGAAANLYVLKITVDDNYTAAYKEGSFKVTATVKATKKAVAFEGEVISDVTIFEYEQVKWAAAEEDALDITNAGYSDYETYLAGGYGDKYVVNDLRSEPNATVVSTTAFRAVEGKDLTVVVANGAYVTVEDVAAAQKGVNFAFSPIAEYDANGKLVSKTGKPVDHIGFAFLGNQVVKSDYTIVYETGYTYYTLREAFDVKVEEDDILTYYILKDGKLVQELVVDYMTADIDDEVVLEIEGSNATLGEYEIRLDVNSAADAETEENPNTGAESVVGVVAALAVVSVATAAAVSLKK